MDNSLTELYMKFLCEHLKEKAPPWKGNGEICYKANVRRAKGSNDIKTIMHISGDCPRSLSFRMADIIRFHREKIWSAPVFIIPREGDELCVEDNIVIGSNIGLGTLAEKTASAMSIFLEKYLIRE